MKPTINICSIHPNPWLRQFPDAIPQWHDWRFIFNADKEKYDYLIVFDDLHKPLKPNCPIGNIIHLGTEPPTVHRYNVNFLQQFPWYISQDPAINHPGKIEYQPGLTWFIGWKPGETDANNIMSFHDIEALFEQPKSKLISVISSNKTMTLQHKARLEFAQKLKLHYADKIDFFGRGFVPMDDKLNTLKDYRFQVVLENSSYDHYFSEKLTDCFLAGTYPIYYGCPNLDVYFPENSYRRININNFEESIATIDQAIAQSFDKKYRSALLMARNKALNEHNLFPMLIHIIEKIENGDFGEPNTPKRYDKKILPFRHKKFYSIPGSTALSPIAIVIAPLDIRILIRDLLCRIYKFIRRITCQK